MTLRIEAPNRLNTFRRQVLFLVIALVNGLAFWTTSADAQLLLTVDLARVEETDTVRVPADRYQVRIVNRVPRFSYEVRVSEDVIPISAFEPDIFQAGIDEECGELKSAVDAFKTADKESEVPALIESLGKAEEASSSVLSREDADEGCLLLAAQAKELRDSTTKIFPEIYRLKRGRYVTVTVTRREGSEPTEQWSRVFSTGPRGEWRVTYGYAFPVIAGLRPSGVFGDAQTYHTEEIGEDSARVHVIRADNRRNWFDPMTTVFFSWMPASESSFQWNPITAGLSVDLNSPTVLLGTGFTYNSNLQLHLGIAARQEKGLLGRYVAGDTVDGELTIDQLHENVFRLRPYVALTFRFTSNPFRREKAEEEAAQPEARGSGAEEPRRERAEDGAEPDGDQGPEGGEPTRSGS